MWSNFYDAENSNNTKATVGLLFDLLEWNFATESVGFDLKFSTLGIVVNLEHFLDGFVEFCNRKVQRNFLRPSRAS